jgi:hypothetical protein
MLDPDATGIPECDIDAAFGRSSSIAVNILAPSGIAVK